MTRLGAATLVIVGAFGAVSCGDDSRTSTGATTEIRGPQYLISQAFRAPAQSRIARKIRAAEDKYSFVYLLHSRAVGEMAIARRQLGKKHTVTRQTECNVAFDIGMTTASRALAASGQRQLSGEEKWAMVRDAGLKSKCSAQVSAYRPSLLSIFSARLPKSLLPTYDLEYWSGQLASAYDGAGYHGSDILTAMTGVMEAAEQDLTETDFDGLVTLANLTLMSTMDWTTLTNNGGDPCAENAKWHDLEGCEDPMSVFRRPQGWSAWNDALMWFQTHDINPHDKAVVLADEVGALAGWLSWGAVGAAVGGATASLAAY